MFLNPQGQAVGKIGGYMPPDGFAAQMERIIKVHRELPALQAKLEADPGDLETAGLLISVYALSGDTNRCRKILRTIEEKDPENETGLLVPAYSALADCYIEKGKFPTAIKYYKMVAERAEDAAVLADARMGLAYAHYMDSTRFPADSKPAANRVKKAKTELEDLMARADLPADRKEQARQLLARMTGGSGIGG